MGICLLCRHECNAKCGLSHRNKKTCLVTHTKYISGATQLCMRQLTKNTECQHEPQTGPESTKIANIGPKCDQNPNRRVHKAPRFAKDILFCSELPSYNPIKHYLVQNEHRLPTSTSNCQSLLITFQTTSQQPDNALDSPTRNSYRAA